MPTDSERYVAVQADFRARLLAKWMAWLLALPVAWRVGVGGQGGWWLVNAAVCAAAW